MKKDYEKPMIEVVDFQAKDKVANPTNGMPEIDESVVDDF